MILAALPASSASQLLEEDPGVRSALNLLDLWLDAQVAYEQIPGASLAVIHDQDQIWARGYGHANREDGIEAAPGTIYSICSISKLFTSIGVLQQRDEGRLRLDDPIRKHLPWFRIQEEHSEFGPATIQGVLTHSSGLPRESNHPYWSGPAFQFPTREEIMEGVADQETLYPTLTYYQYSNLGLTLAGEVVAAVSGMPYDDYVRSRILEPLGMDHTTPEIPAELWGNAMAVGYGATNREGERVRLPMFQARGIAPAAGFASTVEDLGRFASWQFRVLAGKGGEDILDRNTLREMHRVHWMDEDFTGHRGLGFGVWRDGDKTFVGHGGSCPGYRSHLALQTDDRIAVAFAANALGVSPNLYTRRAYEIVAPAIRAAVKADSASGGAMGPGVPAEPPAADYSQYVGTYRQSFGGESAVLIWKGKLAVLYLPTDDPLSALTELRHVEGDTFRRVRDDGTLGEEFRFEVQDGEVIRFWRHNNRYPKIR